MPTADLRALTERLGMARPCPCNGTPLAYRSGNGGWAAVPCWACGSTGQRMPTEAEVRAAIFEAGWGWVETGSSRDNATAMIGRNGVDKDVYAHTDEADPDDLVLLALLRALEAARNGR